MTKRFAGHQFGLGPEKNEFLESFALLLSSGIDLLSALSALRSDMRSKRMQELIARMEEATKSAAMENFGLSRYIPSHGYLACTHRRRIGTTY